jgi:hypothetical protein
MDTAESANASSSSSSSSSTAANVDAETEMDGAETQSVGMQSEPSETDADVASDSNQTEEKCVEFCVLQYKFMNLHSFHCSLFMIVLAFSLVNHFFLSAGQALFSHSPSPWFCNFSLWLYFANPSVRVIWFVGR